MSNKYYIYFSLILRTLNHILYQADVAKANKLVSERIMIRILMHLSLK